jgi:hypothetical protein
MDTSEEDDQSYDEDMSVLSYVSTDTFSDEERAMAMDVGRNLQNNQENQKGEDDRRVR